MEGGSYEWWQNDIAQKCSQSYCFGTQDCTTALGSDIQMVTKACGLQPKAYN